MEPLDKNFNRLNETDRIPRRLALMDKLHDAAAEASAAFPHLSKLVILHIPTWGEPLFVSPEMVDQVGQDTEAHRAFVNRIAAQTGDAAGTVIFSMPTRDGTPVSMVALKASNRCNDTFPARYTQEMAGLSVLDLALGRLITGSADGAEAYAALRHIQRFGLDTDYADYRREVAGAAIVLSGNAGAYTADALELAVTTAQKMGEALSQLPLQQTGALAAQIAADSLPDEATLGKIRHAYHPVAAYLRGQDPEELPFKADDAYKTACLKTFKVMTAHAGDADIFRAGQRSLSHPGTQKFLAQLAEGHNFWKIALEFINAPVPRRPKHLKP